MLNLTVTTMSTIVIGIGNLLMGDEGVGVHIAQKLEKSAILPETVDILDGGTGGFHLLGYFQNYDHVILIDATADGKPPGTISVLEPKFSSDYPVTLTAHDIGLKDLIDALYLLDREPHITLFTVTIDDLTQTSISLSPAVQSAVDPTITRIMEYLSSARKLEPTSGN